MPENFYEIVHSLHDKTFELKGKNSWSVVLHQCAEPIRINFPDIESSPPIVFMKLDVYCDVEDIPTIKKAEQLKLII